MWNAISRLINPNYKEESIQNLRFYRAGKKNKNSYNKKRRFRDKKGKKFFFKNDYASTPKYFGKETVDDTSRNDRRKKFNFKKRKNRFKNRSRPKAFKFKKFRKNRN